MTDIDTASRNGYVWHEGYRIELQPWEEEFGERINTMFWDFFDKSEDGHRHRWLAMMKASIESVVPQFSAHRMVRDYVERIYMPAASN